MKKNKFNQNIYNRRINSSMKKNNSQLDRSIKTNRTLNLNRINILTNKNKLETNRIKSIQITSHRRKISLIFVAVFVGISLVYFCIMQLTANFQVLINDTKLSREVDHTTYEKALDTYSNEHPLSRVRSMLDKQALTEYLLNNYPEVLSIHDTGKTSLFDTAYQVNFRKPVAKWRIDNTTYYVDSNGITFLNNYFEEPDLNIIDNSGIKMEKGEAVVSNKFLRFIGRIVEEALNKGYFITEAIIPLETTREVDIKLKGRGFFVKMSVDRDILNQVEDMNSAILYFDKNSVKPTYVDIRISGKAFYK